MSELGDHTRPAKLLPCRMLIDGATGTELARAGVDISLPLWSARAVRDAPEALRQIHEAYLRAGAEAITAATFRTTARTMERAGLPRELATALTRDAVAIARAARDAVAPDALVLGSVAPLEECYDPSLAPPEHLARAEHERLIADLLDAGADAILIETMGAAREARAAAAAARCLAPGSWMVSLCTRGGDAPGVLLSGEAIVDLLDDLAGAAAIGVNCVAAPAVEAEVRHLRPHLDDETGLVAYANIGFADEQGNWISTDAIDPARYAEYAARWLDAGATIIGGCCGTTPATIAAVKRRLRRVGPARP